MGRMKELNLEEQQWEWPLYEDVPSPSKKAGLDVLDSDFDEENWHPETATGNFPSGCGPDFESSEDVFPERPVVLIRETLCYADTGEAIRSRTIRR